MENVKETIKERMLGYINEQDLNMFSFVIDDGSEVEKVKIKRANPCNNSYSVAKAFAMTAIGMLYDEGKLSINDKITDILREEYEASGKPERKWEEVTVDNTLRHRMGIAKGFLDIDTEDATAYGTDDYLSLVWKTPITLPIGEERVYSDAAYYVISRIVEKISGETLADFLWKRLFYPLGFREVSWSCCPKGHSMGATGLYIRTEDMAKLGRLYLNNGVWNGERIISEEWISLVLSRAYEFSKVNDKRGYTKGGMCGQRLYFCYEDNVVVAWHAYENSKLCTDILKLL